MNLVSHYVKKHVTHRTFIGLVNVLLGLYHVFDFVSERNRVAVRDTVF